MTTITMFAPTGVSGTVVMPDGTSKTIASDGTISVDSSFRNQLETAGWVYGARRVGRYRTPAASTTDNGIAAASAAVTVASVTMTNGGLTIAAQPDVPRPLQAIVGAGTSAITAGALNAAYYGVDGVLTTDALSLVCSASATLTINLSKAVVKANSFTVTGLTGGATPFIYIGTTATFGVPVDPGASIASLTALKEVDYAGATFAGVDQGANIGSFDNTVVLGAFTPHAAPAATVSYDVWYSFVAPS